MAISEPVLKTDPSIHSLNKVPGLLGVLLLPIAFLVWVVAYRIFLPLPFYSYFADPELAYLFSALELAEFKTVQLHDHPGTLLQLFGVLITACLGMDLTAAFDVPTVNRFRLVWLCFSCAALLLTARLIRKATPDRIVFATAFLLLFHDFHAFAFWGRFTPEGAFFSLYMPVLMLIYAGQRGEGIRRPGQALLVGLVLGCATTVKITLWPVTAFFWLIFWVGDLSPAGYRIKNLLLLSGSSVAAYCVLGSAFAIDRGAQFEWFLSLITESGRYGGISEHGAFLPLTEIATRFFQGLRIQSYTALIPLFALGGWAIIDIGSRTTANKTKIVSAGFLICLAFTFFLYAKHPYQMKYLLPQTLLFTLYFIWRTRQGNPLPAKVKMIIIVMFTAVTLNALASYHVLHIASKDRNLEIARNIDAAIEELNPKVVFFSMEVPHPRMSQAFAVREARRLGPHFEATVPPTSIFRERAADYSRLSGVALPLQELAPETLIVTAGYFEDPRVQLVWADADLRLFMFYVGKDSAD